MLTNLSALEDCFGATHRPMLLSRRGGVWLVMSSTCGPPLLLRPPAVFKPRRCCCSSKAPLEGCASLSLSVPLLYKESLAARPASSVEEDSA